MIGLIALICIGVYTMKAQDPSLKVHYRFNTMIGSDSIADQSGNGFNARLQGGASLKVLGSEGFMQTGGQNGYLDMGEKMGLLVKTLSDFTISTYVYIDVTLDLTRNGNFVWSFSNAEDILSNPIGCMFYSAKVSQYAISPTNWNGEQKVGLGTPGDKGKWQHVAYTQSGTVGTLYLNGVSKKSGSVTMLLTDLGATKFNYLARSSYSQDQYLRNSAYNDFRIYNRALSGTEISSLASKLSSLDMLTYAEMVQAAKNDLTLGDVSAVTANLTLPLTGSNGAVISWGTSNAQVVSANGTVVRPPYGSSPAQVTLTATISVGTVSDVKEFIIQVVPFYSDAESVQMDFDNLVLQGNLAMLRSNLWLPSAGAEGSTITWQSGNGGVLSSSGEIVGRPDHGNGDATVTLTATITKGNESRQKVFLVTVAEDEGYVAYLFAYFTGNSGDQESIRFATSTDGYEYKALNGNRPVISSSLISTTGGVRDPHVLRGEGDNTYYLVVTDMVSAYGWNSNRAMVLLKSTNLVDWTHANINIPQTYPQYAAADRIWAPQTIYDSEKGKYMVYFSMRLGPSDTDKIYYAYANSSFSALESAPQLLFENPGVASIDGDIVFKDGLYHLFFKTEGAGAGIKRAVSNQLTSGYVIHGGYLQQTSNPVEGGCVFRMYNSDKWILMYDMYTSGAYQFTQSYDLEKFEVVPQTVSFDFSPRHGTIIPITQTELNALNAKWNPASGAKEVSTPAVRIYPVPAQRWVNVQVSPPVGSGASITVYTMGGAAVMEQKVTGAQTTIDLSELAKGVYLLRCINGQGSAEVLRLLVE